MQISIPIDKNADIPIYRQIVNFFVENIENNELESGFRLPTERELSQWIDVSRGTVKKAYKELENRGFIKVVWGSGTYILENDGTLSKEGENALSMRLYSVLESKGYTDREMEVFLKLQRFAGRAKKEVYIAAVDCNIEALKIFHKQLSNLENSQCFIFLLDEIENFKYPDKLFGLFDIIFTTTGHYKELTEKLSKNIDKVIQAAVSPDKDTVINILKTSDHTATGVFAKSERFREIVENNLISYGISIPKENCMFEEFADFDEFEKFIENKQSLIMPPVYAMNFDAPIYESLLKFVKRGGNLITFNYTIEKGSIIYIEEKVSRILYSIKE